MSSFGHFGFCGYRKLAVGSPCAVALLGILGSVPAAAGVAVGCAAGADALVRSARPSAVVFKVESFGSVVARSIAFVRSLPVGGLLVAAPYVVCPASLSPSSSASSCFCGKGSGSWASVALAVGCGVSVQVVLPASVLPPSWWLGQWVSVGGSPCGGSVVWQFVPAPPPPSLF